MLIQLQLLKSVKLITRLAKPLQVAKCFYSNKIPDKPQWKEIDQSLLPAIPELDDAMISHLERLSLVEFNNKEGVEQLRSAIEYASQLYVVNTDGVEPMYSVLEDEELLLSDDVVSQGNCRKEILQNAVKQEEDYFVAPPGNIPLVQKEKAFGETEDDVSQPKKA